MQHHIGDMPKTAIDPDARIDFLESELRKICALMGFTLEPASRQIEGQSVSAATLPVAFSRLAFDRTDGDQHEIEARRRKERARMARAEIKKRRTRDRFFQSDLFADPAWDILLDLYASHYEGRSISVSSACIAAAVPATTALRWLKTLSDNGQIIRDRDNQDGRRIFVAISEQSLNQLDAYFDEIEVA